MYYTPNDSDFYNLIEKNVTKANNKLMRNFIINISNSQREQEVDINNLLIKKYEKENETFNQNPKLDINTLESIRISHSFEKSKISQSLTDIINDPYIKAQRNLRDENCINQTIQFINSNCNENESNYNSNKFFEYNYNNDNIVDLNNLISNKGNKNNDLNRKNISAMNENFYYDNTKIQNIIEQDDNNDINNNIESIYNKIFDDKIKLINEDNMSTKKYLKEYDYLNNKNKINHDLIENKNKVNYLSLINSKNYSTNNKDKELDIEIYYNNKEREIPDNSIYLNNRENKALNTQNIDSIIEINVENMKKENEEKKNNRISKNRKMQINKEKKNHSILYVFENENENDSSKNVLISELDIKIPRSNSKKESDVKNSPKEKTEKEKNINNTNGNECIKEKKFYLNRKNLNTDRNTKKGKQNNIINYFYKKTFKYNKNLDKKLEKKIYSYKNIKGKTYFNCENAISKIYNNNNPFPNLETKAITQMKNIINSSRTNCSFLELNNSITNRKNINNKTHNSERNNKNYSRILNTSRSLPKNKKIEKNYLNSLFKKKLYTILKNAHVNKNIFKKFKENNVKQNNEIKEQLSSNKITYTHSIESKRKINHKKLSKINTSLYYNKMNRTKDLSILSKFHQYHFNTIRNNSHKKNLHNISKNNKSNRKKDFSLYSLYNINKDKILFKNKIKKLEQKDLYLHKKKLLNRKNLNNFFKKENLYRKKIEKNNHNTSVLLKNDIKIKSIINNSFTQKIYFYNYKKANNKNKNNNLSNSVILTNINNRKNAIKQYKSIKPNEKIITDFKPINKYNTYIINHFINFKMPKINTNKKRKIINNKFTNKTNITNMKNLNEKNNLLNFKIIKKNASELNYKINNILITINNNSNKNKLTNNK